MVGRPVRLWAPPHEICNAGFHPGHFLGLARRAGLQDGVDGYPIACTKLRIHTTVAAHRLSYSLSKKFLVSGRCCHSVDAIV